MKNVHKTAKEARQIGEALGLEGSALDLWVKAGGIIRQELRIEAALKAAEAWAADWYTPDGAVVAALLDAHGVGGHLGTGQNGGTRRHPAFANCGSGRKFAQDGDAWTAAIAHVASAHSLRLGRPIRLGLAMDPARPMWGPAAVAMDEDWVIVAFGDNLHTPARDWVVALARAIVVGLAIGEGPWSHQELELAGEIIVSATVLEPLEPIV